MTDIMRGGEPFYFKGDDIGCLMVHGFTGTPKEVRWLGERLADDGHTVLGVRLAGHATTVEQMRTTRWPDWYADVLAGYAQLRRECSQIFVMGLSMGGGFALHLAANEGREQLAGIVVMAAPVRIVDWRIPVLRPFRRWIPYWPKGASDMVDAVARDAHLEYDRMPTDGIASLLDHLSVLQKNLSRVTTPTLLIYSQMDKTAPLREMYHIYHHISSKEKRMIVLQHSGHIVCEDVEKETTLTEVRAFVREHVRETMVNKATR